MRIEVEQSDAVKQGDFLTWKNATDPFLRHAVVVTGDCDLARGKHWGKITVVPVMSIDDYAHHLAMPRILEAWKGRLNKKLAELIASIRRHDDAVGVASPEDSKNLDLLILDERFEETWSDSPPIISCCRVLRDLMGAHHFATAKECLTEAGKVLGLAPGELGERVANALANPPGDVIFIPTPESLGFEFGVAWLRVLREVEAANVATKLSQLRQGNAMRVARLGPVFRYRLTQCLGQVFSDIGLPADYESELKTFNAAKAVQLTTDRVNT